MKFQPNYILIMTNLISLPNHWEFYGLRKIAIVQNPVLSWGGGGQKQCLKNEKE